MSSPIPTRDWPRMADTNDTTGLQCFGCGRCVVRKGTQPTRWIEVLCPEPDCPGRAITGLKPATEDSPDAPEEPSR